jgi:F-type H+-transporting ATPase subunit gamma
MTERLADVSARIEGVHQLGAVVDAMRGIAAARAQRAVAQLRAVDAYTAVIAAAIGRALALPEAVTRPPEPSRPALLLFLAEQGFAGALSEHVLDAAGPCLAGTVLFLVGTRGLAIAAERGRTGDWTAPMPAHAAGIPRLAKSIAAALYAAVAEGRVDRLDAVFAQGRPGQGIEAVRLRLLPLDPALFPRPPDGNPPLLNLPADALLRDLAADHLHAQLCHAALHAFAAENEARVAAMAAARRQVERQLDDLLATQRRLRQDEITAEIIELAAGETASRARAG